MSIGSPLIRYYGAAFLILSFPVISNGFGFRKTGVIPKSPAQRNSQMAQAVQAAISSPRVPSFRLLECEFPAIEALNKLGDGSLQSAQAVDEANIAACTKLVETIAFPPFLKPPVWLVTSRTASQRFTQKVQSKWSNVHSLQQQGPVRAQPRDVFVFIAPAGSADYQEAKRIAMNGNTVVIVNGFAKDNKSVPGEATMAYFLKPLTYNSQIAGYLTRTYPDPWTVLVAAPGAGRTKKAGTSSSSSSVLETFTDADILVPGTNTPDLRASVRLVQKATDERAIQSRSSALW